MNYPSLAKYTALFSSHSVDENPGEHLHDFIVAHPLVRFIRLQWQDHSGIVRARIIMPKRLLALTKALKPVHTPPIAFHCIVDNNLVPGLDPTGSHYLIPDWASLRLTPAQPHYATVMCGVIGNTPSRLLPNLDLCPRLALANVMKTAAERFGIEFKVGFEVEFEVLRRVSSTSSTIDGDGHDLMPAAEGLGRYAIDGLRDPIFSYIEEVIIELLDHGVDIEAVQTEGRRGQYELSLGPRSPLEAVDELVLVHDTLKTMIGRHGLVVTMAPKPFAARRQATGQHTHISISDVTYEREFLAGILHRLPSLCATCMPYDLSYERAKPYLGGNRVAWGTENREVPIRKIRPGHWEVRCVDATANMYLALAATLGSGLLGIEQQQRLTWPDTAMPVRHCMETDCPETKATAPDSELPSTLEEALQKLELTSSELGKMMNSEILQHYLFVKKFEAAQNARKDPQQVRNLLSALF
ncbi:protein fluG [Penicillium frequentans]|nr:protein fluG [Penicillium glabrum]